jgi:hypothetical protein
MKKLVVILAIVGSVGYYVYQNKTPSEPTDPIYAEIRLRHENGVELVGIAKMFTPEDCERRSERFWNNVFKDGAQFEWVSGHCTREISERHLAMFSNKTIHATYISMDRGSSAERDGRFVIYGVPSSDAVSVCPALINKIREKYTGKIQCIQGTIG